jgi:heme exporter protein D
MNWSSWAEFWAMGGYGTYVWGSYLCVLGWLLLEPMVLRSAHKRAFDQILEEME